MTLPTSEKRLTRSQARAVTPKMGSTTPSISTTPSSATKSTHGFSKAGRRVLGELACNDSPIIGLLPAGTPASSKQKSSNEGPLRSRRALLASTPSHPASMTPLGESLLRSQVQLLLQRVESDAIGHLGKAPSHHLCEHSNVGSGITASPMMLAAPTPLNTPEVLATTTHAPVLGSQCIIESSAQSVSMDAPSRDDLDIFKGVQIHQQALDLPPLHLVGSSCTMNMSSSIETQVQNAMYTEKTEVQDVSSVSNCFTVALSTTSYVGKQPLSENSDIPSSGEIFLGKRTLFFDDGDTPCKSPVAKVSDTMMDADAGHLSSVRELDDDEVSEWSVHVNVGSPADKQSAADLAVCTTTVQSLLVKDVESSSINEHLKKMQQVSSSKVDLLWDEARERKMTSYGRDVVPSEEYEAAAEEEDEGEYEAAAEEEEDEEDYSEYYSGREEEEDAEECDSLCDMFREMRFEEGKGLPRGEGKHIRFLYEGGEDEISEAMVVLGEEEVFLGGAGAGIRLKGLPAPLGRHWRFLQEDGEGEDKQVRE